MHRRVVSEWNTSIQWKRSRGVGAASFAQRFPQCHFPFHSRRASCCSRGSYSPDLSSEPTAALHTIPRETVGVSENFGQYPSVPSFSASPAESGGGPQAECLTVAFGSDSLGTHGNTAGNTSSAALIDGTGTLFGPYLQLLWTSNQSVRARASISSLHN